MMDTEIDRELLEKIADLLGKPVGAFNIRKDCGCDGRESTEHIKIDNRADGKSGIPVIITKPGIEETVYNDFYIGENCDVTIVAGCGIHNCGDQESRHDGIHTFHVGRNSHVHYSEKHYAEGDGTGAKVFNPQTIVYLDEGASIQMDTVQIRGVDSTKRYTKIVCGKDAEAVITERLLTHGTQSAHSDMEIVLDGEGSRHYRQLYGGAVSPRGRHRENRRRPAFEAGNPGLDAGGGGRADSGGLPGLKRFRSKLFGRT